MKIKLLLFSLILFFSHCLSVYAQSSNIHYFPVGDLTFCKGCGHDGIDTWRGKFRVENLSDKDLILYGWYMEGKFLPAGMIQRRNPDVCEWQYPNRKTTDIEWDRKSSLEKEEFILKAKQILEFESHFNGYDFNKPTRFTFYVGTKSGEVPEEGISDAFSLSAKPVQDESGKFFIYETPVFSAVNNDCDPGCKLSIEQSPSIRGIKLGMTLEEFKKLFPNEKIKKADKYNSRYLSLYDKDGGARWISITFLNDKVIKFEVQFYSVQEVKGTDSFYLKAAEKFGLEKFWTPNSSIFECKDFEIEIMPDNTASTVIRDKAAKEIWEKIVEDSYKK